MGRIAPVRALSIVMDKPLLNLFEAILHFHKSSHGRQCRRIHLIPFCWSVQQNRWPAATSPLLYGALYRLRQDTVQRADAPSRRILVRCRLVSPQPSFCVPDRKAKPRFEVWLLHISASCRCAKTEGIGTIGIPGTKIHLPHTFQITHSIVSWHRSSPGREDSICRSLKQGLYFYRHLFSRQFKAAFQVAFLYLEPAVIDTAHTVSEKDFPDDRRIDWNSL